MNIFRLLGEKIIITLWQHHDTVLLTLDIADFSHLTSIFILLQKMKSSSVYILSPFICTFVNKDHRAALGYPLSHRHCISLSSCHDTSVGFWCHSKFSYSLWHLLLLLLFRFILDIHRLSIQHNVQNSLYWLFSLRYLSYGQWLWTDSWPQHRHVQGPVSSRPQCTAGNYISAWLQYLRG